MTQKQERLAGWDLASKVAGTWVRFQIKASSHVMKTTGERRFKGAHHQLMAMADRATTPGVAYYVFPTLGTTKELTEAKFDLLPNLRFVDAHQIPPIGPPTIGLGGPLRKNGCHYFFLSADHLTVTIRSDPQVVSTMSHDQVTQSIQGIIETEPPAQGTVADSEEAAESVREFINSGRGRVALFLPSSQG